MNDATENDENNNPDILRGTVNPVNTTIAGVFHHGILEAGSVARLGRIRRDSRTRARTPIHTSMANPPATEPPAQILVSGVPPPPPPGSLGLDLSYGNGSDRRAYFRNEVEAAMQRVRDQESADQRTRNQRAAANNFNRGLGAILQQDAGSMPPPSPPPPRPRPLPPPTPVANPNSVYRVLTVEPSPLSQTPGRMTYQDVIDRHRTRVKAPARKFMALVDTIQEKISDNTYLEMANTCKEMYEIIEELEPTSIEGFRVSEVRDDDAGPTIQERIQELEEENERLARVANETEDTNIKRLKTIVDLRRKLEQQTALAQTQAKHLKAQDQIYAALKAHPFVGPGIYHLKAVTAIKEGIDGSVKRLPRWFNGHVKDEWRLKPHIIKTVAPAAPAPTYVDTEYAEGFGALGFGLDDLDALWRVWKL